LRNVSCSQQVRDSARDVVKKDAEILADLPCTACFPPPLLADVPALRATSASVNGDSGPDANHEDRIAASCIARTRS
jgi:hypothetical protein